MPTYYNYVAEDYWVSGYAEGDIHSLGAVSASTSVDLVAGERVRLASSMASSTGTQLTAAMSKFFLASVSSSASATAFGPRYIAGSSGTVSSTSGSQSSANILVSRAMLSASSSTTLITALTRFNLGAAPLGQSAILATPEQIAVAGIRLTATSASTAAAAARVFVSGRASSSSLILLAARILWEAEDPAASPAWETISQAADNWAAISETAQNWSAVTENSDNWILIPDNSNNWTPLSN